uniref:Villin-1 n=1 Tax=Osmerus mordax TaxID=8014 RepID=C1BLJ2_OSMMO|nr:Villin-1 [Osmerus mordax]
MPQIQVKTPVKKVLNKTTPGLQIWRIEDMEVVPFPSKAYGQFFEGDSYIILYTTQVHSSFTYDIHFWLGKSTSQDEQGAAAIYTTLMDDHLGGVAVQHREMQGYESDTFRGYFKQGIVRSAEHWSFDHSEEKIYISSHSNSRTLLSSLFLYVCFITQYLLYTLKKLFKATFLLVLLNSCPNSAHSEFVFLAFQRCNLHF